MKTVVFDTGPIISLTMNNLLWLLPKLKENTDVRFLIPRRVKEELVDTPLYKTKRFKFEALQVLRCIEEGVIEVHEARDLDRQTKSLADLANTTYTAYNRHLKLIHPAEVEAVALSLKVNADLFVVDERTTRLMIENPKKLVSILEHRLHTKISVDQAHVHTFSHATENIQVIRSVELATIAFEKGLLNKFIADIPYAKKTLLESVLWGIKLHGCAVSKREIEQIMRIK